MRLIKMKYLIILLILASCATPNRLIKQIKKKQIKLEQTGYMLPRDTVIISKTDTILSVINRNDTIIITKLITNTITLEPIVEYKTRWQTKTEVKYKYKYLKQEVRIEKEKTKQVKHENKGKTWWLLWLGLGLGVGGTLYIKK